MKIKLIKNFIIPVLTVSFLSFSPVCFSNQTVFGKVPVRSIEKRESQPAEWFLRTELYFGMNKPGNGVVTEDEWNDFLAEEVTKRFPDGFTVLQGTGQYRGASGKLIRENSRVLVFLYPVSKRLISSRKIEQLRAAYKKKFLQESVMRLDFQRAVKVSF